jgi:hypothetical protein
MRILKKIVISLPLALVAVLLITVTVFAAPVDVTHLTVVPTDTTLSLTWTKPAGATNTIIQYKTASYPANPADGTNGYNGTSNSCIISGLTAGTTYFIAAWGFDGVNYSPDSAEMIMTTTAGTTSGDVLPTPTVNMNPPAPSSSGWFAGLQPFSGFVQNFEISWGMNTDMMQFTIGIIILLLVGIVLYIKFKSPFIAIAADLIVDIGLIIFNLLPPYSVGYVIAFGLGVWALENIWI